MTDQTDQQAGATDRPIVTKAETVNVGDSGSETHLPYAAIIATVTLVILMGFSTVTYWVLVSGRAEGIDPATKGAILQTWNNLVVTAAGFWVGSSLAGKMRAKP